MRRTFTAPGIGRSLYKGTSSLLFLILMAFTCTVTAQTLPAGFAEVELANGLDPTAFEFAPDGRIFISEKNGKLRIIKNGVLRETPFLTLNVDNTNERGLMGVVLDPQFTTNAYVYVYYSVGGTNFNRLSRFTAAGDVAVPGSELVLLDFDIHFGTIHNGGALVFDKDGKLYIATGDCVNANAPQSLTSLLGKIIRINPDGSIPTDNPYYTSTTGNFRSIWAMGFRNPFSMAIQPGTDKLFVGDVGHSTYEEIDDILPGKNYGWPTIEGPRTDQTPPANYQEPYYYYNHRKGCSITGGAFYNPAQPNFPQEYVGKFFFTDYCGKYIKYLIPGDSVTENIFATGIEKPVGIKTGPDGGLYYINRGVTTSNTSTLNGSIRKIYYTGSGNVVLSTQPANKTASVGESATFAVSANGAAPIRYQWHRDGVAISGATAASYTISSVTMADNAASFHCIVANASSSVSSDNAILTVTNNQPPTATFAINSNLYVAGTDIIYSGTASDPEQGNLPASAYTWKIDLHHDTHSHPVQAATSGAKTGTYSVPRIGETSSDVWYRIYLTVTDDGGLSYTTFQDVYPKKAEVTLTTVPAGMQLKLDGATVTTPYTFTGVVGITREIAAISPQAFANKHYAFSNWSDGGSFFHEISTPAANTTYTAAFTEVAGPPASGTGLAAEYYSNQLKTFNEPATLKRVDPKIDFSWNYGSPDAAVSTDLFTVRWSGEVLAPATDQYIFYAASDDGVRLWVNDVLLIDKWNNQNLEWNDTIALTGGQKYSIRMEYYENKGGAKAKLYWSSTSISKQIVPTSYLYPGTTVQPTPEPVAITAQPIDQTVTAGSPVTFTVSATGTAPITYQWQRDSVTISGATAASYTIADVTLADNAASFRCIVSNASSSASSQSAVLTVSSPEVPEEETGLMAAYYSNQYKTFHEPATLTRVDPKIDFSWDYASPDAAISTDLFTVRWTGEVLAPASDTYTFGTNTDDGVRLWVNDVLLVDRWTGYSNPSTGTIALSSGQKYSIKVEYFENKGRAKAKLYWSSSSSSNQIIPNQYLSHKKGTNQPTIPVAITAQPQDQLVTAGGSATFTVSATGTAPITYQWQRDGENIMGATAASYTITSAAGADNGARFRCIVSNAGASATSNSATLTISSPGEPGLMAAYFSNQLKTLNEPATLKRVDSKIDFSWDYASPDAAVSTDLFTVRWSGEVLAPATGQYTFYTATDDGVRLWVNDVLLIDKWLNQNLEWNGIINLTGGQKYSIRMEYYENKGRAKAKLYWSSASISKQIIPSQYFSHKADAANLAALQKNDDTAGTLKTAEDVTVPANDIILYPNPSAGEVHIHFEDTSLREIEIAVYNLNSAGVYHGIFVKSTEDIKLNLDHLKAGLYFVVIKMKDRVVRKTLVIF